jgi:poly-beta-1,6-N-acetyl-D-glucosamine biosynthesis protein PgaD
MKNRASHYVIDTSLSRSIFIILSDSILTFLVWILYFYLMRDFFYFMYDVFSWASSGFVNTDLYPSFKIIPTIVSYIIALFVLSFLFIGWALYNKARYGKMKRRKSSIPVDIHQLAKVYNVKSSDVSAWQAGRIMVVHHDRRGHITDVLLEK